jgi:hypothetical protein
MVTGLPAAGVTVVRLRLRDPTGDPARAGTHAGRLLAGASLRPGLPPAAVLVVRSLADPAPGAVHTDAGQARLPQAWEQAVSASLERAARRAARPAREPVPAGADAVLFADRAELLACLARDWGGGDIGVHWWWRGLVGGDPVGAVARAWLDAPRHVPAALALLAGWGEAIRFADALDPEVAGRLASAVAGEFGLEALAAGTGPVPPDPSRDRGGGPAPPSAAAEPWSALASEAGAAGLAPRQRRLLGLGLAIRRDLPALRASRTARTGDAWRTAPARPPARRRPAGDRPAGGGRPGGAAAGPPRRAVPGAPAGSPAPVIRRPPRARRPPAGTTTPPGPADGPAGAAAAPAPPAADPEPAAPAEAPARPPAGLAPAGWRHTWGPPPGDPAGPGLAHLTRPVADPGPATGPAGRAAPRPGPTTAGPGPGATPAPEADQPPATGPADLGETIETGLGGLFYLLNLGLYLELYGDFTTPGRPGIPLDPWDFVTLLGRRLLGEPVPDDPIWATLARLAGRDKDEPPGAAFTPPPAWRLPPAWLDPFDDHRPWRWSLAGGRLLVEHPAGFLVLDVAAEAAAPTAHRELAPYRPPAAPRRGRGRPHGAAAAGLPGWVERLAAYAGARLQLALGLRDRRLLAGVVFHHQAQVLLASTQVDVVFRLDELPLQVRAAGLDRDPGWLPAAGRTVAFHFR